MKKWMLLIIMFFSSFVFSKEQSVVLMYHHIAYYNNSMNVTPELFKEQMAYLYENNYNIIPATELVKAIKNRKTLPPKSVVLTFDDGWKNQKRAMKILEQYKYPALFALITKYQTFRNNTYLSKLDIKKYKEGIFEFVNHSQTHRTEDFFNHPEMDVKSSKSQIINTTGKFIPIYVYPYGKTNEKLKNVLIENGYIAAFGVYSHPVNIKKADIFNINRYLINDSISMEDFIKIVELSNY